FVYLPTLASILDIELDDLLNVQSPYNDINDPFKIKILLLNKSK
ncbi:MAG: hypothetical protein RLZZ60_1293, partial [Bacteroidota bacterium]